MLLSGMSTTVVTPPAAAERVAVAKPSHSVRPGSFMWTWASTIPGMITRSPKSSIGAPAGTSSHSPTLVIFPRSTWIEPGVTASFTLWTP